MRILALVTQKGGSGKTTLALNLAVAAEGEGRRALILDLDPQHTATQWYEARDAQTPLLAAINPEQLDEALAVASQRADIVLIDTPGRDAHAVTKAIQRADFALVPCQPTLADIRAQRPTVQAIETFNKPAAFVLTRCNPKGKRPDAARQGLQGLGLPVCPVLIVNRMAYPDAYAVNQAVIEYEPDGKAAQEIRELWQWSVAKIEKLAEPVVAPLAEAKTA